MAILWNCDFEDQTFGGRDPQQAAPGRATIITSPVRGGTYACRLHTEPGDVNVSGSGPTNERCDLLSNTIFNINEGDEFWHGFSVLFPDDFYLIGNEPLGGHFYLFSDVHSLFPTGQANFNFDIDTTTTPTSLRLRCYGGTVADANREDFWLADFKRNVWYDIVVHALYTSTGTPGSSTGFVEVWVNGEPWQYGVRRYRPLLYEGFTSYLKAANYHSTSGFPSSVIHDNFVAATTRAEVDPARFGPAPALLLSRHTAAAQTATAVSPGTLSIATRAPGSLTISH